MKKRQDIKNIFIDLLLLIIAIILLVVIIVFVNKGNINDVSNNTRQNLPSENETVIEEKELDYGVTLKEGECFIQLKVVDEDGNLLQGEYFELYTSEDKFICQFATNEKGIAVVRGLDYGDYYIRDVASPKGFIASEADYDLTLSKENIYDATQYVKYKEENIEDRENGPYHKLYNMEIEN